MATVNTCASYTRDAFDLNTSRHVAFWAAKVVKKVRADAIVACGHSGLVLAGAVGLLAHVPVFAVRKAGEASLCVAGGGATSGVKRDGPAERWVWLDDFFCSGGTFARSANAVLCDRLVRHAFPVAALCYRNSTDSQVCRSVMDRLRKEVGDNAIPLGTVIPEYGYDETLKHRS